MAQIPWSRVGSQNEKYTFPSLLGQQGRVAVPASPRQVRPRPVCMPPPPGGHMPSAPAAHRRDPATTANYQAFFTGVREHSAGAWGIGFDGDEMLPVTGLRISSAVGTVGPWYGGVTRSRGVVMADFDDNAALPSGAEPQPRSLSRRRVLRDGAGAGAVGIAAAALIGGALPAAQRRSSTDSGQANGPEAGRPGSSEPVVVHVRDAVTGEMDVFRGTTQNRMHDRELAARLLRASA